MTAKIIDRDHDRRLVIEAPNRCEGKGCSHDGNGQEWRPSYTFEPSTSIDYARVLFERYGAENPKSGPYRLVEYVTVSTTTMEVLEP